MKANARAMLVRVQRLEQDCQSPTLRLLGGSLESWEQLVVSSIEDGTLCPNDGPVLFHAVRRWADVSYDVSHPLLAVTRKDLPAIPDKPEPPAPAVPVQTNTHAEHERLYQEFRKNKSEGARQYLQAKEEEIRNATRGDQ